jgi:hypothetical protein
MATAATPISRAHLWTGRILSGLAILFLVFDTVIKLIARARWPPRCSSSAIRRSSRS